MSTENKNITILGAGLVGSLLSIYLSRRGYNVSIYERRVDMRKATIVAGRSISLKDLNLQKIIFILLLHHLLLLFM